MILTLSRPSLLDALSVASTPVDSDPAQPILATVRLTLAADLEILGTDLTTTAVARVAAQGVPGSCAANARTLIDRVKLMPEGPVKLTLTAKQDVRGGTLTIEGGSRRFAMAVQDAAVFPNMTARPATGEPVSVTAIAGLLDRGGCAMSEDRGSHPIQRVIAMRTEDGWTEIGSACSREAAMSAVETGLADFPEVLVPHRGVEILRRFLSGKGNVRIEIADSALLATRDGSSLAIRLAEPSIVPVTGHQYRSFIVETEKQAGKLITVHRAMALSAIQAVASASDRHHVRLEAHGTRMRIAGKSDTGDECEDEIVCQCEGDVAAVFDGDSIGKMLAAAATERVSIRVAATDIHPVVVKEIGELDARAWWLTMPIPPTSVREEKKEEKPKEAKGRKKKKADEPGADADAGVDAGAEEIDPRDME